MKIKQIKVFSYQLDLVKPLTVLSEPNKSREGLILQFTNDQGLIACSEVAPLPGLHRETLSEVKEQLLNFLPQFLVEEGFTADWYPSVRMAIDLAVLQLKAASLGKNLLQFLNPQAAETIRLRTLIDLAHESDCVQAAIAAVNQGYGSIKLKVGRQSLAQEVRLISEIRKAVGFEVEITLDANRAFTLNHSIEFGRACYKQQIAYIEEPTANFKDSEEFYQLTKIPVGLDESLPDVSQRDLVAFSPQVISTLVIKPGLIGGFKEFERWIAFAHQFGIKLVVTSSFESGLGHSLWAVLASIGAGKDFVAHGLGTFSWLKDDLFMPPFRAFRGSIDLNFIAKSLSSFRAEDNRFCQLIADYTCHGS